MKFYTGHLEYDEIYYDTRVRMETVCREENENTWGARYPGCYIAISKITTALMTIVVAVADNSIKESTIICYVQKIIEEVALKIQNNIILEELEKLRLKEVTLNAFRTVINDNALNRLFSDKAIFLEKIGLSENDKCFKEYLLDTDYWDKKKRDYNANIVPREERERIAKGKKITEPMVQPVQYVVFENNPDTAKVIIQELLHYLCLKGRVCSRRIVKVDESDFDDVLENGKIQNLIVLDGGVVVLYFNQADTPGVIKTLLYSVYEGLNNYSNKYTAIIVLPKERKEYSKYLREYCAQWAFVKIYNKALKRKEVMEYFQELLSQAEIEDVSDSWQRLFEEKEIYTQAEVLEIYKMWYRNIYNISNNFQQYYNVVAEYFRPAIDNGNAREELENLIGLKEVKEVVSEVIDYFKLQQMRNSEDNNITKPSMHMVFYGNPGTAKTTVARLIGKILKEEKILEKGDFYEVGRADLVGKYVGWTARNVKEYFEKAKGSVLFIDEAYALVDEQNSFGDEAINTIVQEMENHREDVVLIMAGYKEAMHKLMDKNQGLNSRVSFFIEFPDYTLDELYCIMQKIATSEGFDLAEGVREAFVRNISSINVKKGNGRLARNILERAKIRQASRVLKLSLKEQKQEMMIIRNCDFD